MKRKVAEDPIEKWMRVRPVALLALCFLLGIVVGRAAAPMPLVWTAGALIALAAFAIRRERAFFFSAALLLGAAWVSLFMVKPAVTAADGVILTGRVDSETIVRADYARVCLTDVGLDGQDSSSRVMLYLYGEGSLPSYGERVSVRADTWLPADAGNPGEFDYEAWLWRQRIALCASARAADLSVTGRAEGFSLIGWSLGMRAAITASIRAAFDSDCEDIAVALVTGDRLSLPQEIREDYRRAGVSHLLALSGLHVCALFACMEWLLCKCRAGKRTAFAISLGLLAVYSVFTGFPPSIVRAGVMYAIRRAAGLKGRSHDPLTGMSAALLILLLADPLNIEDAGFVLSFSAVGGMLMLPSVPIHAERLRGRAADFFFTVRRALNASLAAQLGTIPAIACFFNQLPVWFLPFNVVLVPLMTAFFPVLLIVSIMICLFPLAGPVLAAVAQPPIRLVTWLSAWSSRLPWSIVRCADWPFWLIAAYALALFFASPYAGWTRRRAVRLLCWAALALLTALGILMPGFDGSEGLEIVFLDVGQADAAVIRAEGNVYLMDVGEDNTAARYLLSEGLTPKGVFLSHGHADHAGGLGAIVDSFDPAMLYVSCQWDENACDGEVLSAFRRAMDAGWTVTYLEEGDEVALSESVAARVWNQRAGEKAGDNENSMVVSVSFGRTTALFTGDLPSSCEMIELPDCDVLKVAHHGAESSTGEIMLAQTTPSVAVISVGVNSYGHPSDALLERLSGMAVYRTDEDGAITVKMGENGAVRVSTWRERTAS